MIIYICGHLNIDLLNNNVNNNAKYIVNQMSTMSSSVSSISISFSSMSFIIEDLITNSINENITSGVVIADISDHFPNLSILQKGTHTSRKRQLLSKDKW